MVRGGGGSMMLSEGDLFFSNLRLHEKEMHVREIGARVAGGRKTEMNEVLPACFSKI